jgi:hypothetical protein
MQRPAGPDLGMESEVDLAVTVRIQDTGSPKQQSGFRIGFTCTQAVQESIIMGPANS